MTSGLTISECPQDLGSVVGQTYFDGGKSMGLIGSYTTFYMYGSQLNTYSQVGAQTAATMTYIATALGVVHKSNGLSIMTINEKKEIKIIRNGF